MNHLYEDILRNLEGTVNLLAGKVPEPQLVEFEGDRRFRHVEKTIYQAIVQKLVRMVSTLDGARLLLEHGFVQEQASLQRILDEIQEDIAFLVYGILRAEHTSGLHSDYLNAFFEEEFDAKTAIESTQRRPMIRRRRIQAYLARTGLMPHDPSTGTELLRTLTRTYSGYIHAASPHIMDMYGGMPPRFHMRGTKGTPVYEGHREDLRNYFCRAIITCALASKVFGDEKLFEENRDLLRQFETMSE